MSLQNVRLFTRAIRNESTAPNYILATIKNRNTGQRQRVCIEAPFLLGAIHFEYGIPFDGDGMRRVEKFALDNWDGAFTFSKREALENVAPRYDARVLAEVKARLQSVTTGELKEALSPYDPHDGWLHRMYQRRPLEEYDAYRDAIAYVALERGLLPTRGCAAGFLYLQPPPRDFPSL